MLHRAKKGPSRPAAVGIWVIAALPAILGFVALSVDIGMVYTARADMQSAADAAALASIARVSQGDSLEEATEAASYYVSQNTVLGTPFEIDEASDVIYGHAYWDDGAEQYAFVAEDLPTNAVRVSVRATSESSNGEISLFFAPIIGKSSMDVTVQAVAMLVDTKYEEADCYDVVPAGKIMMCHYEGDSDDSDDSQGEFGPPDSDDSDDSDTGDSDGNDSGDSDDSDDSESSDSEFDSDAPHTILASATVQPLFEAQGDTLGPCICIPGDSDDSDDSQGEFGDPDSSDSDDSDTGDSDGSFDGDSDDSDDSQGEFGPPDSDDSDDSDTGDSDGSHNGDSDDSDDSQGEFGDPDSDDSDDSDDGGVPKVTICHIPPGNPSNAHTITVGAPAVDAHMINHGDSIGECDDSDEDDEDRTRYRIFLIG